MQTLDALLAPERLNRLEVQHAADATRARAGAAVRPADRAHARRRPTRRSGAGSRRRAVLALARVQRDAGAVADDALELVRRGSTGSPTSLSARAGAARSRNGRSGLAACSRTARRSTRRSPIRPGCRASRRACRSGWTKLFRARQRERTHSSRVLISKRRGLDVGRLRLLCAAGRAAGEARRGGADRWAISVWRDDELPAHRAYAEVIEERLKSAKAVVVLWSAEAAKSQWVRAEADAARDGRDAGPGESRRNHAADAVQPDPMRRPAGLGRRRSTRRLAKAVGQRRRAGRRAGRRQAESRASAAAGFGLRPAVRRT